MINIAQLKLSVQAGSNGTFVDPLAASFNPAPYSPMQPTRSLTDSLVSQTSDAITTSPVPGMAFASLASVASPFAVTSLTAKNNDLTNTVWLSVTLQPAILTGSNPLTLPPTFIVPILPTGIMTLSCPISPSSLILYTPQLGLGIDYILLGS